MRVVQRLIGIDWRGKLFDWDRTGYANGRARDSDCSPDPHNGQGTVFEHPIDRLFVKLRQQGKLLNRQQFLLLGNVDLFLDRHAVSALLRMSFSVSIASEIPVALRIRSLRIRCIYRRT